MLEALGSCLVNKYSEGYPGARYVLFVFGVLSCNTCMISVLRPNEHVCFVVAAELHNTIIDTVHCLPDCLNHLRKPIKLSFVMIF